MAFLHSFIRYVSERDGRVMRRVAERAPLKEPGCILILDRSFCWTILAGHFGFVFFTNRGLSDGFKKTKGMSKKNSGWSPILLVYVWFRIEQTVCSWFGPGSVPVVGLCLALDIQQIQMLVQSLVQSWLLIILGQTRLNPDLVCVYWNFGLN